MGCYAKNGFKLSTLQIRISLKPDILLFLSLKFFHKVFVWTKSFEIESCSRALWMESLISLFKCVS